MKLPSRSAIDQVNQLQQSILQDQASMVEKAIQAGHLLIDMKAAVDAAAPKTWMKWCDDNIRIGRSQIGNYMTAARREALLPNYQSSGNTGGLSGFLEYTAPAKVPEKLDGPVENWLPKGWKGFNKVLPEGIPKIGDLVQYFDHAKGRESKDLYIITNASIDPSQDGRGMYKYTLRRSRGNGEVHTSALNIWPMWMPEGVWEGGERGLWLEIPDEEGQRSTGQDKAIGDDYLTEMIMSFVHIDALWDAVNEGKENPQAAAWEVTKEFVGYMKRKKKSTSEAKAKEATP